MTYTEKELDQFLHGISLSLLSKKSAQHWRYDEETAKEIEWLEVLEQKVRADKADRKTEPMKTTDYCDICKRDMCEDCIADATNPYCVPSHYEINYEPKDEPKTQMKTQNSNLTF